MEAHSDLHHFQDALQSLIDLRTNIVFRANLTQHEVAFFDRLERIIDNHIRSLKSDEESSEPPLS